MPGTDLLRARHREVLLLTVQVLAVGVLEACVRCLSVRLAELQMTTRKELEVIDCGHRGGVSSRRAAA